MLFKQIGSNMSRASLLLADIARFNGEYKEARTLYMEIEEHFRLLGGKFFGSMAIVSLGELAMEEGNLAQAQKYVEEALATARELEDHTFIAHRRAELGNIYYLQGNTEKFKQNFKEGIRLAKGRDRFSKSRFLVLMLKSLYIEKPENAARLLGVIDSANNEMDNLIVDPLFKRDYYAPAETHTRKVLGDVAYESAFAEGQKMSLDEALDMALKMVEEM